MAGALARRYNLRAQFDLDTELSDMVQSALVEFYASEHRTKVSLWRGIHNHIRLLVFGNSRVRTKRMQSLSYEDISPVDDMLDTVEWWRIAERIPPDSPAFRHYLEDLTLKETGRLHGVGEARACQRVTEEIRRIKGVI